MATITSTLGTKSKLAQRLQYFPVESWIPLLLAALLWIYSLSLFNLRAMQDWGLVSIFPVSLTLAYLVIIFGFASLFTRSETHEWTFAAYIFLLIWMIHGTPQLVYGTLRYSWAWKHIGIVDYIIRHGAVDPKIGILGVYHNWPGFFALNALFTQLAGFPGAQVYAGWGPVFFETLFAMGLRSLFCLFTPNRKLQWLGVWIFLLTNWIAQDYFSPQATSYFMLLGVLVLLLRGFSPARSAHLSLWRNGAVSKHHTLRLPTCLSGWLDRLKITTIPVAGNITRMHRWVLGGLTLICFSMIVSSHQLTPNVAVAIVLMLTLSGYAHWKTLPVWMSVLIILWLLLPARTYNSEAIQSIVDSYNQVTKNIDSGLINVATVSNGQVWVAWIGRGLTVLIGILAGLGTYRRIRHHYFDLPVILLAVTPVLILFVSSYGGEAIFRVYFFSVPFLSFLAAGLFLPNDAPKQTARQAVWVGVVSIVLLVGMVFAYYGKDQQYYFTKGEVEAAEYLYEHAEPHSLLIEGSRNYPSQFMNYEYFTYVPIDRESVDAKADFLNNPVAVFYRWLSNSEYTASYFIITRSQKSASDSLGSLPFGALDHIQKELEASDVFEIVYFNQDAVIFRKRARD